MRYLAKRERIHANAASLATPNASAAAVPPTSSATATAFRPLLDRSDIHVEVPAVKYKDLAGDSTGEPSSAIRERIQRVRQIGQRQLEIPFSDN